MCKLSRIETNSWTDPKHGHVCAACFDCQIKFINFKSIAKFYCKLCTLMRKTTEFCRNVCIKSAKKPRRCIALSDLDPVGTAEFPQAAQTFFPKSQQIRFRFLAKQLLRSSVYLDGSVRRDAWLVHTDGVKTDVGVFQTTRCGRLLLCHAEILASRKEDWLPTIWNERHGQECQSHSYFCRNRKIHGYVTASNHCLPLSCIIDFSHVSLPDRFHGSVSHCF